MIDEREATCWLNYPGDVRAAFSAEQDRPYGPTTTGEYLYAVDAEYDSAADRTRVGFTPISRPLCAPNLRAVR